jgi:hypothetical protein
MWWHMRINQISSYCDLNVMAHAHKPDFVLLRLKCDGTCAETRFRLTAIEMWWNMRRNQISSYCDWNVMEHAQKTDFVFRQNGWVYLNRLGRQFSRLLAAEVCGSAVVMLDTPCFLGSVKSTGYPFHLPVFLSLPLPLVTVCRHISTGLYPYLRWRHGQSKKENWVES